MPQTTECSSCGKAIRLPDDSAGKKIKCGGCETTHKIEATDGGTLYLVSLSPPSDSGADKESPPIRARAKRGGRRSASRASGGKSGRGRVSNVKSQDRGGARASRRRGPSNFLVPAIVTTLFCCAPAGIVAIVYAVKVDSAWLAGRDREAYDYSKKAQTWTVASVVLTVIIAAIWGAYVYSEIQDLGQPR